MEGKRGGHKKYDFLGGGKGRESDSGFPAIPSNSKRSHSAKQRIPDFRIKNNNPGFPFLPGKSSSPEIPEDFAWKNV